MILVFAIVLATIIGLVTRGSFAGVAYVRFRYLWLLFAAILVQVAIFSQILGRQEIIHSVGPYIHIATLLASLVVMWKNVHIPGMKIIMLGAALNLTVIVANGGFMPATEGALDASGKIEKMEFKEAKEASGERSVLSNSRIKDDDTNLWWLGDVWAVPDGFPAANVFSIGDVVLALGAAYAIVRVMHLREGPRAEGRGPSESDSRASAPHMAD